MSAADRPGVPKMGKSYQQVINISTIGSLKSYQQVIDRQNDCNKNVTMRENGEKRRDFFSP